MRQILEEHPKMQGIKEVLEGLQPGLVAVSGGVDSRFLATLIASWHLDFRAVFFAGPQITDHEKKQAVAFLASLGIGFDLLRVDPLLERGVRKNDRQRCYFCKKSIFGQSLQHGLDLARPRVIEGSHLSDRTGYRPGLKALSELGIFSPLAEAGFRKPDIRKLAGRIGVARPDQPSRPCLLTRFAYGYMPGEKELERVGRAEDTLCGLGLSEFRIRVLDRARVVLQVSAVEEHQARLLASRIQNVLEENRLTPFEILITQGVSGFFDQDPP